MTINKNIISFFVLMFFSINCWGDMKIIYSERQILAGEINSQTAKDLSKKLALRPIGTGLGRGENDTIKRMSLSFEYDEIIDYEKARELVVISTLEYLDRINSNEKIRPHLFEYPFKASSIELVIFFPKNKRTKEGERFSCAGVCNGKLSYMGSRSEYGMETFQEENFEEAERIVMGE